MSENAILGYLNLICGTKYHTRNAFFADKLSFDDSVMTPLRSSTSSSSSSPDRNNHQFVPLQLDGSPTQVLPIHDILFEIEKHARARTPDELNAAANFFEPMILDYWQLTRLLDVLRTSTKILQLPAQHRANVGKIKQLRLRQTKATYDVEQENIEREIVKLQADDDKVMAEIEQERQTLATNAIAKDNIQAALVVSTLLNVIFRDGMSVPMLSDRLHLEAQQEEYRSLLQEYGGITFDLKSFPTIMAQHRPVSQDPTVSLVTDAQSFHAERNHLRLGGLRTRREGLFLKDYLKNDTYTAGFDAVDPYLRTALSYFNWIFFIPRLTLNFSILYHHLYNEKELRPLERALPKLTRFRAHWTRFWFEVINDLYWFVNGLLVCFVFTSGILSLPVIYLSLTVQALDLTCMVMRAFIELYRLYRMTHDLQNLDPNLPIKQDLWNRFGFEAYALGYMVCHFGILMLALCLTLPSMAAVSTMWPVVGGACAVMMTVITYYAQNYFSQTRQGCYEARPEPLKDTGIMERQHSLRGMF